MTSSRSQISNSSSSSSLTTSTAQIRGELLALRDAGCAVLVVSEELDELFEICDRLLVIARGRVSPSVATREATVERIGEWMSGLWTGEASHAEA